MNYIITELYHHGILGQKWGVRRFQNADGSLTSKGRSRYAKDVKKLYKKSDKLSRIESKYEKSGNFMKNKRIKRYIKKNEKYRSKYSKFINKYGETKLKDISKPKEISPIDVYRYNKRLEKQNRHWRGI